MAKSLLGKIVVDGMLGFVPAAYFEGSVDDLDSFGGC